MTPSPQLLALQYGLRLDASPEFIRGYVDGMRLDQRGQGVACGRGWISRSKKCSRDKASQTSKEAKARTVEKSRERAKLKGEVKAAKGQKPYVKPSRPNFAHKGDRKTASPGTVFYDDPNATPEQKAWMKEQGQDYIPATIASRREIDNTFPDVKKTAEWARSKGYKGDDYEVVARMMAGGAAAGKDDRRRNADHQNVLPIHWEDEQPKASSSKKKPKRITLKESLETPPEKRPKITRIADSFKENDAPYLIEEGPFGDRKVYAEDAYSENYMIRSQNSGQLARYYAVMSDGTTQGLDSAFLLSQPESYNQLKKSLARGNIQGAARQFWKNAGEAERKAIANSDDSLETLKKALSMGERQAVSVTNAVYAPEGKAQFQQVMIGFDDGSFESTHNIRITQKSSVTGKATRTDLGMVAEQVAANNGAFYTRDMMEYVNPDTLAQHGGLKRIPDVTVTSNYFGREVTEKLRRP